MKYFLGYIMAFVEILGSVVFLVTFVMGVNNEYSIGFLMLCGIISIVAFSLAMCMFIECIVKHIYHIKKQIKE
jgi:uncharacterized membrane protein YciS (DUF1049 family)